MAAHIIQPHGQADGRLALVRAYSRAVLHKQLVFILIDGMANGGMGQMQRPFTTVAGNKLAPVLKGIDGQLAVVAASAARYRFHSMGKRLERCGVRNFVATAVGL